MLKILAERKLFRVLTEGGPRFLSLLIENNLLDELCLTVAPVLVGGVARRIATGPGQVPSSVVKAIPILARTAGLLAHLAEEQQEPIGFLMAGRAEEAIEYVPTDGP